MAARDYDSLSFAVAARTGIMAAGLAANSEIFQFRYVGSGTLLRPLQVRLSAAIDTVGFTAGASFFDMVAARGWTAAGTGGTAQTLTGNNGKMRTAQNATLVGSKGGEIRVATTAALGAGTKTLDAQALASISVGASAAAGAQLVLPGTVLWNTDIVFDVPYVVAHQEGFVIRANVPATGTWSAAIEVLWAEANK